MGWSYGYHQVDDVKYHLEHNEGLFKSATPGHSWEVLDSAIVGTTYYAAVRRTMPDHKPYVFATVILFRNPKSGFGYKDLDESMGPCEVACPLRILNKLSPIEDMPGGLATHEYADQWRENVRLYHRARAEQTKVAKSFKEGDKIKLPSPLSFRGIQEDTFTITGYRHRGKNLTAYLSDRVGLCRIPQRLLDGAVKLAA
jgi:hypothetical protein